MASIFNRPLKGVHVPHHKNTKDSDTVMMPPPKEVSIVMQQHMGPPCDPLVKPGDEVKVGQVIGDSQALLSAPIHSSISGTVARVDQIIMPNGQRTVTVHIESDGEQTMHEDIRRPVITDRESFIKAVRVSGLVGLGGAGFPTHVKFSPKNPEQVDTLVVNTAECEPYITSDYRTIMEDGKDVLSGIHAIMKWLEIPFCKIGVEDNKPEGIRLLEELTRDEKDISVVTLKSKYPQGAEKVLVYETTGRVVPEGKLPADVGVIVSNINTIAILARYLRSGVPLIKKRVTVDGGAVKEPKNVLVNIGTRICDLVEFCGGYKEEPRKLLMGGPMMGTAVYDDTYPVLKNNNAILALTAQEVENYDESACIRCGRCVRSCPMNLMPLRIEDAFIREDMDGLREYRVNLCMECGCCAFSCPARRHLVQTHRLAKVRLKNDVPRASLSGKETDKT